MLDPQVTNFASSIGEAISVVAPHGFLGRESAFACAEIWTGKVSVNDGKLGRISSRFVEFDTGKSTGNQCFCHRSSIGSGSRILDLGVSNGIP